MKHLSLIFLLAVCFHQNAYCQTINKISLNQGDNVANFSAIDTYGNFDGYFSFNRVLLINKSFDNQDFVMIYADNLSNTYQNGNPSLPTFSKIIEIPFDGECEYSVVKADTQFVNLDLYIKNKNIWCGIKPASKNCNPQPCILKSNNYVKNDLVTIEYLGTQRSKNLIRVSINPFYLNENNILTVYNNLKIKFVTKNGNKYKTDLMKTKYGYETELLPKSKSSQGQVINNNDVTYIIIAHPIFTNQAKRFAEYKTSQGYKVKTVFATVDVSNTPEKIITYLKDFYNNPPEGYTPQTYVLIMGDINYINSIDGKYYTTTPDAQSGYKADSYYVQYTEDNLTDAMIGRMSASTTGELDTIITKTINYENCNLAQTDFLQNRILIAGVDPKYAPINGDGQIYYLDNFCKPSDYNINDIMYPYNSDIGIMKTTDGNALTSVIEKINNGAGIINYTGHGSESGWTNPAFNINNLESLTENGCYGVVIANCCESSRFEKNDCFATAMLRKKNSGAVAYIGASNLSYWDEDYYWSLGSTSSISSTPEYSSTGQGAFDGLYHNGINEQSINSQYITVGEMINCGILAVIDKGSSLKNYYTEIYHLSGDPSLMPYLTKPSKTDYTVSPTELLQTSQSMTVTTEPYSMVAISQNNVLIDMSWADIAGNAVLSFESNALSSGTALLSIISQNKIPVRAEINVLNSTEVNISLNKYEFVPHPAFGEISEMDIDIENIATSTDIDLFTAKNVILTLTSSTEGVSVEQLQIIVESIAPQEIKSISKAFSVKFSDSFDQNSEAEFNLNIKCDNAQEHNISLSSDVFTPQTEIYLVDVGDVGNAQQFESEPVTEVSDFSDYTYEIKVKPGTESDDIIQAGEKAIFTFEITNNGTADIENLASILSADSKNITIENSEQKTLSLKSGEKINISYNIKVDDSYTQCEKVEFKLINNYYSYVDSLMFEKQINNPFENFESFDSQKQNIINDQAFPWIVTANNCIAGNYTLRSGEIPDDHTTSFEIYTEVTQNDSISFYLSTSCENAISQSEYWCDYLAFFINNKLMGRWTGETAPKRVSYTVNAGNAIFKWIYVKDLSDYQGKDLVLIDNIKFPPCNYTTDNNLKISSTSLPDNLTLTDNGDNTALISGKIDKAGSYPIKIAATRADTTVYQAYILKAGTISDDEAIKVYPQPAESIINIITDQSKNYTKLKIFNSTGQFVHEYVLDGYTFTLDIRQYKRGVYIFEFGNNESETRIKVLL